MALELVLSRSGYPRAQDAEVTLEPYVYLLPGIVDDLAEFEVGLMGDVIVQVTGKEMVNLSQSSRPSTDGPQQVPRGLGEISQ